MQISARKAHNGHTAYNFLSSAVCCYCSELKKNLPDWRVRTKDSNGDAMREYYADVPASSNDTLDNIVMYLAELLRN